MNSPPLRDPSVSSLLAQRYKGLLDRDVWLFGMTRLTLPTLYTEDFNLYGTAVIFICNNNNYINNKNNNEVEGQGQIYRRLFDHQNQLVYVTMQNCINVWPNYEAVF